MNTITKLAIIYYPTVFSGIKKSGAVTVGVAVPHELSGNFLGYGVVGAEGLFEAGLYVGEQI